MSLLYRTRNPSAPTAPTTPTAPAQPVAPGDASGRTVRQTPQASQRATWVGICTGAIVFATLIVFMLQNTRNVEISFLGLHGALPLAMALLIAMAGGILLTAVFDAARLARPRLLTRGRRH